MKGVVFNRRVKGIPHKLNIAADAGYAGFVLFLRNQMIESQEKK
jgi:hypothetical protein